MSMSVGEVLLSFLTNWVVAFLLNLYSDLSEPNHPKIAFSKGNLKAKHSSSSIVLYVCTAVHFLHSTYS